MADEKKTPEVPDWNEFADLVGHEIAQRRDEGYDVSEIEGRVNEAKGKTANWQLPLPEQYAFIAELEALQPPASFRYEEPSTLAEIKALRPDGPRRMELSLNDDQLLDRIYGGWLGRAAGCMLGKPVEAWTKRQIDSYLEFADALPLDDYIPHKEGHPDGLRLRAPEACSRGKITSMIGDDDTDYTILGLHILERWGPDFDTDNVAETWLDSLSYEHVYTAEKMAYKNLRDGLLPPESASHQNPFREWIGAQIRADSFGYAAPGWPEKAAQFAFNDAAVSHTMNGIYGEMFVAAMLAAAFVTTDIEEVINIGLSEIPANCRLAEAVLDTVGWCKETDDWEQAWTKIKDKYRHWGGAHTIGNACLVVLALIMAKGDYEKCIVIAVRGGWDTDCNGATAGSVAGVMLGAAALPEKWIGVMNDRIFSGVQGFSSNKISDLAGRTLKVAKLVGGGSG